ncbi:MAG: futalosine hydrolase [Planctomycetota bacterium]
MASLPALGSPTLLLFPTELERRRFRDQGGLAPGFALRAIAGFGPIAAAARTSQLIAEVRPARVLLLGIAGAYDIGRNPIGTALAFSTVAVDGIGAGQGRSFQGPPALGFPQWPGSPATTERPVQDRLPLALPESGGAEAGLLLTTCAASDSTDHAAERLERFPAAVAEDMEGFAVALACALAGVPCAIVRGISNLVGDREPSRWRIPAALAEARRVALAALEDPAWAAPAPIGEAAE